MFKAYLALLFYCCSFLFPFSGQAMAATSTTTVATEVSTSIQQELDSLLVQVEKKYARLQSLECSFLQRSQSSGRIREGSGQAFFFRPGEAAKKQPMAGHSGIIRWEYLQPEAQTIINDGQEIQIYTPSDKQLLITSAADLDSDMTYALFTGQSSLTDTFLVSPGDNSLYLSLPPSGLTVLHLVPREPQSQLKQAQIWVNKDLYIERLLIEDYFNDITVLSFTNMRFDTIKTTDSAQIKKLRTLNIPEHTEIIRQ